MLEHCPQRGQWNRMKGFVEVDVDGVTTFRASVSTPKVVYVVGALMAGETPVLDGGN